MTKKIDVAIRATLVALKAEVAQGKMEAGYQGLVEEAIQRAEEAVGAARPPRPPRGRAQHAGGR